MQHEKKNVQTEKDNFLCLQLEPVFLILFYREISFKNCKKNYLKAKWCKLFKKLGLRIYLEISFTFITLLANCFSIYA